MGVDIHEWRRVNDKADRNPNAAPKERSLPELQRKSFARGKAIGAYYRKKALNQAAQRRHLNDNSKTT